MIAIIKLDHIPTYSDQPTIFIVLLIISFSFIGVFVCIFGIFLLIMQVNKMQDFIDSAYTNHFREHIENKYLKDEI